VTVAGMEREWERAEVNAEIVDEGTIKVETKNVAEFFLRIDADPVPLDRTHAPRVVIDGMEVSAPNVQQPWIVSFVKLNGKWQRAGLRKVEAIPKQHGLSGPIDDAFLDRFIFVRPTGTAMNPQVGQWADAELKRAIVEWRRVFRGEPIVKDDVAITPADMANANLVLWGDPASNSVMSKVMPGLPLKWSKERLELGPAKLDPASYAPVLIYPNPLTPGALHYVVLNSSFTFRMGSRTSNSMQTPKLPDWALIDLRTPADDTQPGLIYDAGFFDGNWRVQ